MGESKRMHLEFSSVLTDIVDLNSSFDKATMRICYSGLNRNGSYISKDTIDRCAHTIYNCPIVCRYDRETDTLGQHDVDVISNDNGDYKVINMTSPIGVIPESAECFWETVTEDDGTPHEYFCSEVLLWKRQEAYEKVKRDGITKQSMEINVLDGDMEDGNLNIKDFEFTAFCLLGTAEPCFESAALLTFSEDEVKQQFNLLMEDLKKEFSLVHSSQEVNNSTIPDDKGGIKLDEKLELMKKYGLTEDKLDFKLEDFTLEELEQKFIVTLGGDTPAPQAPVEPEPVPEPEPEPESEPAPEPEPAPDVDPAPETEDAPAPASDHSKFELNSQLSESIDIALGAEMYRDRWGDETKRYWMVDFDEAKSLVYVYDRQDNYKLFGMSYSMQGDNVVIDFNSKKRMKFAIIDYDDGEPDQPSINQVFSEDMNKFSEKYSVLQSENEQLAKFKADTEAAALTEEKNAIFEKFAKLNGDEAFENLKSNADKYTVEQIEEKCFAIVGRTQSNFSLNNNQKKTTIRVGIESKEDNNEPYGGVFKLYGIN